MKKFIRFFCRWFYYTMHPTLYILFLLFTIAYIIHTIACLSASGTGTTAGITLLSAVGVRQMALGNNGSALAGDACAMFYNPAILSDISQKQLSTFFTTGLSDDYKASIIYGLPITDVSSFKMSDRLQARQKGGLAFGIFHLNGGKMEINYVDGTSRSIVAQSDFLVMLGWSGYWSRNVSVGYNLKYLSTKLVEDYNASAIAFDSGLRIKSNNDRFRFGASGQNYGTSIKYRSKEESLPFLVRSGISYRLPIRFAHTRLKSGITKSEDIDSHSLLATVDGFYIIKEENIYYSAGLEYSISQRYFLRGGIKIMPDRYNFTLGVGLKLYDRFSIDWATELSELNNPHNVTFTVRFGKERESPRVEKPQLLRIKNQ